MTVIEGQLMTLPALGKLTTLRAAQVWGHEAQGFTPWLAQNLNLLAETLQVDELTLRGTEVPAGDFRLDLLAEDQDGNPVIVENQFGSTDHKHLGQLISYIASQGEHVTVVWVAEKIREDHRAAIDWLNANTGDGFDFFALEIEALRIDDSAPAPFLNVIAKPNRWTRSVGAAARQSATGELAQRHRIRLAYWASFGEFLRSNGSTFQIRRPIKMSYCDFSIGRSGAVINATISTEKKRAGVKLYLRRDPLKQAIAQLAREQAAIEKEFGEQLEWQELPGKKASTVGVYLNDVDPSDPQAFPALHAWMLDRMERTKRVFAGRVGTLDFGAAEGDVSEEESSED